MKQWVRDTEGDLINTNQCVRLYVTDTFIEEETVNERVEYQVVAEDCAGEVTILFAGSSDDCRFYLDELYEEKE